MLHEERCGFGCVLISLAKEKKVTTERSHTHVTNGQHTHAHLVLLRLCTPSLQFSDILSVFIGREILICVHQSQRHKLQSRIPGILRILEFMIFLHEAG